MSVNRYRNIPSITKLLAEPALDVVRDQIAPTVLTKLARELIDELRQRISQSEGVTPSSIQLAEQLVDRVHNYFQPAFRTVINATGIVLHTNLGRSPMHESAAKAAYNAARYYLDLELDLETGKRSSRQQPIRAGLCELTGAESATVVNNCAAATVLTLRALAQNREVIVSRGQLIEIGGNFRIPDIMETSGAILKEVGTTNRTRLDDYRRAIGPNTGLLMRIHTSNYRIAGFTESVSIDSLVSLGKEHGIPVIDDIGSGAVFDFTSIGLAGEPVIAESIKAGADLVLFSGDKLLGGPQVGIIAGRMELIQKLERDPLMRAFRCDKMTLAALAATLQLYRKPDVAWESIPTLRMMRMPLAELRERCGRFADRLSDMPLSIEVRDDVGYVGGGTLPEQTLPTCVIAISSQQSIEALAHTLRIGEPSVLGRIHENRLLLDLRTVFPEQEDKLYHALLQVG